MGILQRSRGFVVQLLLVGLAPLALDGCVSVGLARSVRDGGDSGSGAVAVSVYQTTGDRDSGVPVPHPVLAELTRTENGVRTTVARSMSSSWSLDGLPPGRYVLRTSKKIDENGDVVPLKGPVEKEFALQAGERVEAKVVLERVPVLLIVLAVITIVFLVVLAIDAAGDGGIPLPPPPPLPDVFVGVALEIPFRPTSGPRAVEPGVADAFPAPGSVVAARRVAVSFFVTVPLDERSVEEGAILAVGSLSGEIPGKVEWREEERLLRFLPSQDFRQGEDVTVTLDLGKIESAAGRSGSGRATTTFRVP
ncbi:MAG TPA: hypothetical protein VE129_00915 [Thermoanaerobaculia bacterium]|nr:hypothetical protein [Thermoanaerobaculia bacterium]